MTPPVARVAAHIQVGIAFGTVPVAVVAGGLIAPVDVASSVTSAFILQLFLSSIFIPIAGLVISRMGFGKGEA